MVYVIYNFLCSVVIFGDTDTKVEEIEVDLNQSKEEIGTSFQGK